LISFRIENRLAQKVKRAQLAEYQYRPNIGTLGFYKIPKSLNHQILSIFLNPLSLLLTYKASFQQTQVVLERVNSRFQA
jgi:hypothetical protein